MRRVGFVAAFAFKYSPRPYTPALKLGDEVSEEVKDERLARLFAVVATQQHAHLQSLVGQELQVLVEGPSPGDTGRFAGRSERNEIVHLMAPEGYDPTGELVTVTIDEPYRHSLSGYMAERPGSPSAAGARAYRCSMQEAPAEYRHAGGSACAPGDSRSCTWP